jgi:hypothetical protein
MLTLEIEISRPDLIMYTDLSYRIYRLHNLIELSLFFAFPLLP